MGFQIESPKSWASVRQFNSTMVIPDVLLTFLFPLVSRIREPNLDFLVR